MEKLIKGVRNLGLDLKPEQVELFRVYYRELIDWNRRMNLTTITGYEEVQLKHFLDSLTAALAWPANPAAGLRVIDVGTGAGLPGIPLKILFREIDLVVLDSVGKKVAFLEHLIKTLGLGGVEIVLERAETLARRPEYREKFNVVLSRAVAALPVLAELTLPFCALNGRCILHKKGDIGEEVTRAGRAIELLGGTLREVRAVEIEGLEDGRRLVIIDKVAPTPPGYPRRPGIPEKRPLA